MAFWQNRFRKLFQAWSSPFTAPVPAHVRAPLVLLQTERLHSFLPLLGLIIAANAVAMGLAVWGDLPLWQQLLPPVLIVVGSMLMLHFSLRNKANRDVDFAILQLRMATPIAAFMGLVAGIWGVNAFTETEKYYCMVAPVFIGIAGLVCATCLLSAPRAALTAMIATITPIVIKMATFDNLGVRAMAAMMVLVTIMQSGVVLTKFTETVALLTTQLELDRMAKSDSLTGLDNRLAFLAKLESRLTENIPVLVALTDLDGFKGANDTYGHLAGDAILIEVAARMQNLAINAVSVARLGGDEFALLFDILGGDTSQAMHEITAIRAAVPLPFAYGRDLLSVGTSIGTASNPADGTTAKQLLHTADTALYADKAKRKASYGTVERMVVTAAA